MTKLKGGALYIYTWLSFIDICGNYPLLKKPNITDEKYRKWRSKYEK